MTEPKLDAFGRPVHNESKTPEPPQELLLARWLWVASVLIGAVQAFVELLDRAKLINELHTLQPALDQVQLDDMANSTITFTFTIKALTLMVYLLLCKRMLEGAGWARVVLTIFGVWSVFSAAATVALVGVVGTQQLQQLMPVAVTWTDAVFAVLGALAAAAAVVFMFRPAANRFLIAARQRAVSGL